MMRPGSLFSVSWVPLQKRECRRDTSVEMREGDGGR